MGLRRRYAEFVTATRRAARGLRRRPPTGADEVLTLRLAYRPPYDFGAMLEFLRTRALPALELVDENSYARVLAPPDDGSAPGWVRVSAWPGGGYALRVHIEGAAPARMPSIVARARRVFDLDADPRPIAATLSAEPKLRTLLQQCPGLRLPGGWDGFEVAVRAILGQQVSVAAARTLATRLVRVYGQALETPLAPGLERAFPTPAALAEADLATIGVMGARAETIRNVARALRDGRVDFKPKRTLEEFVAGWVALRGIGPWTAQYIALRALGHPDAFPAQDLVLRRAAGGDGGSLSARALLGRAEAWRPWRAYSVIHLWRAAAATAGASAEEKRR